MDEKLEEKHRWFDNSFINIDISVSANSDSLFRIIFILVILSDTGHYSVKNGHFGITVFVVLKSSLINRSQCPMESENN